ncbi:hypothetical protein VB735_04745 [Halotia wernerae UHCC 0503]|nr:hypothetical protein [Halotia wernerae UHCC 0503]
MIVAIARLRHIKPLKFEDVGDQQLSEHVFNNNIVNQLGDRHIEDAGYTTVTI